MSSSSRTEPVWPMYPTIPASLHQPPQRTTSQRPRPVRPSLSERPTLAPGQLYDAIASRLHERHDRPTPRNDQTLQVPTQITVTTERGREQWQNIGLGIGDINAHTPSSLSSSGISRASSAASRQPDRAMEEEEAGDFASRLERKIWQYNRSRNIGKRWILELLSWITSAMCIGAIIVVLILFDKRPLASWKFALSFNTYISVFSRVATSALLFPVAESLGQLKWSWFRDGSKKLWDFEIFDNASRGPWGSFMLLLRTKGSLASVGAIVTIVSLALDPFFQEVFVFQQRLVQVATNSTIPSGSTFLDSAAPMYRRGVSLVVNNLGMEQTLSTFILGNGTQPIPAGNGFRPEVPLACATEHCEWEPYESLAMCSTCTDMAKPLDWGCKYGSVDWGIDSNAPEWIIGQVQQGLKGTLPPNRNRTSCGWFLNSTSANPVLMTGFSQSPNSSLPEEYLLTRIFPFINPVTRSSYYDGRSDAMPDIRYPIGAFLYVSAADGTAASAVSSTRPIAQECVLYWCIKTLKSSYHSGTYKEQVLSEYHKTVETAYPWQDGGDGVDYLTNITMVSPNTGTTHQVSNITHLKAYLVMDQIATAFVTTKDASAQPQLRYVVFQSPGSRITTMQTNPILGHNITQWVDRMASAFTNAYRSAPSGNVLVYGKTLGLETLIEVRWAWITLPAAVLLSSITFLMATMIKSSHEQEHVGIWKTSAIATLLNGFSGSIHDKLNQTSQDVSPFLKAQELKVSLLSNRHGWRVSNTLSPIPEFQTGFNKG